MSLLLLLPRLQVGLPVTTDSLALGQAVTRGLVISRRAFAEPQAPVQRSAAADDTLSFPHVFVRQFSGTRTIAQGLTFGDAATQSKAGGSMPIGGDATLRGVKAYTLLAPTATVAAPYGLAQINTARNSAGVNGIVRFPAAGSGVFPTADMSVAGQTWQLETAATTFAGGINVTAAGCTLEGGIVNGDIWITRAGSGNNFTMRNVVRQGGNRGILNESKSGMYVKNCEFYGQVGAFSDTFYDQPSDVNVDGQTFENCIGIRTLGSAVSMITGHDENNVHVHTIKNFKITNCYLDGGTGTQGHFGIEVFASVANTQGTGAIVEYSDIRGGGDGPLLSIVRSVNTWTHHNLMRLGPSPYVWSTYESAGPNNTGFLYEYNIVSTLTAGYGGAIYHNSGSHNNTIQQNKFLNIGIVVSGSGDAGGGYIIKDNCLQPAITIIAPSGWGIANTVTNDGTNGCAY